MSVFLWFAVPLVILAGGAGYRFRGSSFGADWPLWILGRWRGDRATKLLGGAIPVGLAVLLCGVPLLYALCVVLLTALCDTVGHGQDQGAVTTQQALRLSMKGLLSGIPAIVALFLYHAEVVPSAVLAAALTGGAYWLGNRTPVHLALGPLEANQGPEVGEWFAGFVRVSFVIYLLL